MHYYLARLKENKYKIKKRISDLELILYFDYRISDAAICFERNGKEGNIQILKDLWLIVRKSKKKVLTNKNQL